MAKKKNNAFTIVELLVAMTLLVILLGLSGMVFNTTVAAHRAAGASIDVSRNLRAITEQLSNDLRGLRKDAPLTIWFERQNYDYNGDGTLDELRFDQLQFFADGDFQSTKQYAGQIIYGNMARVYYGQGWDVNNAIDAIKGYREFSIGNGDAVDLEPSNILARRTHISTNNASLDTPSTQFPINTATNLYHANFGPALNNYVEYDNYTSLNLWKQLLMVQGNCDVYLATCFNNQYAPAPTVSVAGRPVVFMASTEFLHNLLAQGVVQMQVQWAYTVDDLTKTLGLSDPVLPTDAAYFTGIRWWPSVDPDGDGNPADSDFNTMANQFGVYFEMPGGTSYVNWVNVVSVDPLKRCKTDNGAGADLYFVDNFYPAALKFTFTLKDSNGIFAAGKTFTHIVYLDN